MSTNPFLDDPSPEINPFVDPPAAGANPFLSDIVDPDPEESTKIVSTRKQRPGGGFYSSDPKERMKQLQEDGKMTPAHGNLGAPAKRKKAKRAAEVIAEVASENAEKIAKVLLDGIDEKQPQSIRMQAVKQLYEIEKDEVALAMAREKQEFEQMSHADLREQISTMVTSLARAGQLADEALQVESVVEAEVVDE